MKKTSEQDMTGLDVNFFRKNGWTSHTSASILQDCGVLLADLYHVAQTTGLLDVCVGDKANISELYSKAKARCLTPAELHSLSEVVSSAFFARSKTNREKVSAIYDLAKHLQAFHALLDNPDIQSSVRKLLGTETVFVHKDSVGIRIDIPREETQLTELHQEFHSYPFGTNGLVIWLPLTRIDLEHGTIGFFERPHDSAPFPFIGDQNEQARLTALGRFQEAQKIGQLQLNRKTLGERRLIEAEPGHCYFFSAVLPHESVPATPECERVRITCQARLFDPHDPFFIWKMQQQKFWQGLKNPIVGWALWEEFHGR